MLPFAPSKPEQLLPFAAMVQWTQVRRLWQGQTLNIESHQAFSHLSGTGIRVPLGLGVTLMPLRHPFEAAVQATSLARLSGHPLIVGYGPGARGFQQALRGQPYRSPLGACREYVGIVRDVIAGRTVNTTGEYFHCQGTPALEPAPRVDVALGVLREKMARLAGEVADAAVTWLTPASHLDKTLVPALRAGAADRPSVPRTIAIVPLALDRPGRVPARVALASNAAHLQGPHYRSMLRQAGIDVTDDQSPREAAQELIDGGAFLYGDVGTLVGALQEFEDAGVDEVVLNMTGVYNAVGATKTLREFEILLSALGVFDRVGGTRS